MKWSDADFEVEIMSKKILVWCYSFTKQLIVLFFWLKLTLSHSKLDPKTHDQDNIVG